MLTTISRLAFLVPIGAFILAAQGPPPGDFGPGPGFGGPGGPGGPGRGHMEAVVAGAPYSGTLTEQRQRTTPDGNQVSTQTETKVYRDAEGRVRREMTRTNRSGQTQNFVTIFDPVAGFEARLNPDKLTANKHALPPQNGGAGTPPEPPSGEDTPQISTVDLGSKTIEGLAATGKQVTITIPAGDSGNSEEMRMVREVWTSTALKIPVMTKSTNPRFGTSTTQLTAVSQTEPDPALFQIPSNYKVSARAGRPGLPRAEQ